MGCAFGTRKYICRLDAKFRLVLPVDAREALGITDGVVLELRDGELAFRKLNGERKRSRPVSRNCEEVI